MNSSQIIIAGHSNATATGLAWISSTGDPELVQLEADDRFVGFLWKWPREADYFERLGPLCTGRSVAIIWDGSQAHIPFLFKRSPPIDFLLEEGGECDRNAFCVPRSAIEALYRPSMDRLHADLSTVRSGSPKEVLVVGTPPPKEDNESVYKLMFSEEYWRNRLTEIGDDVQIAPAALRLKVWLLLQRMMEETARAAGADFLAVPAWAKTATGGLRECFWAPDATHANFDYGAKLRDEIYSRFLL